MDAPATCRLDGIAYELNLVDFVPRHIYYGWCDVWESRAIRKMAQGGLDVTKLRSYSCRLYAVSRRGLAPLKSLPEPGTMQMRSRCLCDECSGAPRHRFPPALTGQPPVTTQVKI